MDDSRTPLPPAPLPPADEVEAPIDPTAAMYGTPANRSRRSFLGFGAAGAVATGGALWGLNRSGVPIESAIDAAVPAIVDDVVADALPEPFEPDPALAGRTLVVVELSGGNDGLSTVVPRDAGVLYDRRPNLHIPDEELLDYTDDYGLNPGMAALVGRPMATLLGVGTTNMPDGSHFEMERRWWAGKSSGGDLPGTGFFGRICDQLAGEQPVTGLAVGSGANPSLQADKAVTMGLSDPGSAWFLSTEDPWINAFTKGMEALADGQVGMPPILAARQGLSDTLAFADTLRQIDTEGIRDRYPETHLGWQFGLTAELIEQKAGLRVIHITHGGFDTHSDQRGTHEYLMMEYADALGAFLDDLSDRGHAADTLVATTSEFGRRVPENRGGTDHGAAGMVMLAGPVVPGIHGEAPSLTNLDDDNLVATVDFEQYYATLAEKWFGIPSTEVLASGANPLDGILA